MIEWISAVRKGMCLTQFTHTSHNRHFPATAASPQECRGKRRWPTMAVEFRISRLAARVRLRYPGSTSARIRN